MRKAKIKKAKIKKAIRHRKLSGRRAIAALERAQIVRMIGATGSLALAIMMDVEED